MLRARGILHMSVAEVKSLVAELSIQALQDGVAEMAAIVPASNGQAEAVRAAKTLLTYELESR